MDETEAANLLGDQSPGHFLIRISSSRAHEGVFVLAVKTRDNGVVQIQIEVSRACTFFILFNDTVFCIKISEQNEVVIFAIYQRYCFLYEDFRANSSRDLCTPFYPYPVLTS